MSKLIGDCPKCFTKRSFYKIGPKANQMSQKCVSCQYYTNIRLPKLSKKIIYLDQQFLSHAFRGNLKEFSKIVDALIELMASQMVVCPISEMHEIETHLWNDSRKQDLWDFERKISRGHEFKSVIDIKIAQLRRGYNSFLKHRKGINLLKTDAFDENIDDWESEIYIDVNSNIYDSNLIQSYKSMVIDDLLKILPEWRKSNNQIKQDIDIEVNDIANKIIEYAQTSLYALCNNDYSSYLLCPEESRLFFSLLGKMPRGRKASKHIQHKMKLIKEFLLSEYFSNLPYVKISSNLLALLKHDIRNGWLQNTDKARSELSGTYFDIEHMSVFAPYCNAIFTEKRMQRWLNMLPDNIFNKKIKVFSSGNIDQFARYLHIISNDAIKIQSFLQLLYE